MVPRRPSEALGGPSEVLGGPVEDLWFLIVLEGFLKILRFLAKSANLRPLMKSTTAIFLIFSDFSN